MNMIRTQDLCFTYPGQKKPCLEGISFSIPKGSIFGLLGPSGAGKSTTVKILTGLLGGYSGIAEVAGIPMQKWKSKDYKIIGVSLDTPSLYDRLTAVENLKFFFSLARPGEQPDCFRFLKRLELEDAADKKAGDFSKGMKVRLNLLRSLIHDPEILFLDEPTSGLDPTLTSKVKELLQDIKAAGKTILLTTHNMQLAEDLCDTVAFLNEGGIPVIESPNELKLQYGKPELEITRSQDGTIVTESFSLEGLHGNAQFQNALKTGGIRTMHSREASLDDIFVKVTGRTLE